MKVRVCIGMFLGLSFIAINLHAGTEAHLWHAYSPPSGETHHGFVLANYKRGIFLGPCGPSTRSLRWSYSFDLKGAGPRFTPEQIELKNERDTGSAAMHPVSGEVVVDEKRKRVQITLQFPENGSPRDFIGNGTFKLHEGY